MPSRTLRGPSDKMEKFLIREREEEERRGIRHCKEGEKSLFISKATGAAEEEEEGEKRDKNAHGSLFLFPVSRFLALGFDARLWWLRVKKRKILYRCHVH